MFDSVCYAREKFLKKNGGYMFPDRAIIYMAPCTLQQEYDRMLNCYKQPFYGLNFKSFIPFLVQDFVSKPYIEILQSNQLLAEKQIIKDIDLCSIKSQDLHKVKKGCVFKPSKDGSLHGFCFWFEVFFNGDDKTKCVVLSTSPDAKPTHWKQTCILLPQEILVKKEELLPEIFVTIQSDYENRRHYDISISIGGEEEEQSELEQLLIETYLKQQQEKQSMDITKS